MPPGPGLAPLGAIKTASGRRAVSRWPDGSAAGPLTAGTDARAAVLSSRRLQGAGLL